jgi:H+/Cl- antiporter ClcA/CBS domain-containing protein
MVKSLLHHWKFFPDWYSARTYVLKFIGLSLCVGSGIFMGRVDVHLCVILGVLCLRLKIFENVNLSEEERYIVLLASSSVGLAANFGVPLAAVLFALELSGSYYRTRAYLKCIYVSIVASISSRLLTTVTTTKADTILAWINVTIPYPVWQFEELPFFIIVGLICGPLGALFVKLNVACVDLKSKYGRMRIWFLGGVQLKFVVAIFVAIIVAFLTFPLFIGKFMSLGNTPSIQELANRSLDPNHPTNAASGLKANDWYTGGAHHLWLNLLIYGFVRYFVTIICFSLPVPGGPWTPLFAAGCGLGRLFGELVARALPGTPVDPGAYAVVFAGALTAGATHQRFSSALIVLELTGRAVTLPLLMAVCVSSLIASSLYPTLADAVIAIRGWGDYVEPKEKIDNTISDYMHEDYAFLVQNTTTDVIDRVLTENPHILEFPVINSELDRVIQGVVLKEDLEFLLMKSWRGDLTDTRFQEASVQDKAGSFYKSGIALQEQNNIRDELDAARARQALFKESTLELPSDVINAGIASVVPGSGLSNTTSANSVEMIPLDADGIHTPASELVGTNASPLELAIGQRGEEPAFTREFQEARMDATAEDSHTHEEVLIHPRPVSLCVAPTMTVMNLHAIFTLCRLSAAYIVEEGRLVGVVPAAEIRKLGHHKV